MTLKTAIYSAGTCSIRNFNYFSLGFFFILFDLIKEFNYSDSGIYIYINHTRFNKQNNQKRKFFTLRYYYKDVLFPVTD